MFVIAGAIAITAGVITRLVIVVRANRPTSPPRSHQHEIDPYTMRVV